MLSALKAIIRARGAGLLRLRIANKPMRVECLGGACGICCSVMGGGVVLQDKTEADQFATGEVRRCGTRSLLKEDSGACVLLENKLCSRYNFRPRGCKEYPYYNVSGRLYYDKGCPGIKFDVDGRPRVEMVSVVEKYLPISRGAQRWLVLLFRCW